MEKLHALIVDDDHKIRKLLLQFLEKNNFHVSQADNTLQAETIINQKNPDIVLLDIMMDGEDGITFCRRIREYFNKPIIMLTAVDDDIEMIVAHEVGADDYLTKPYNLRILLAKIKSLLRRYRIYQDTEHNNITEVHDNALLYEFENFTLNSNTRELVTQSQTDIVLSGAEYGLLVAFLEHPKHVLTRDQLLDLTQGEKTEAFDRSIDVLVSRLRHKLENNPRKPRLFKTIRNGGYMFDCKVLKKHSQPSLP